MPTINDVTTGNLKTERDQPWAIKLFERSPLKQEKYRQICNMLGDTGSQTCLDIGSDNGVISLLLRKRGGDWYSCDIDPAAVQSIQELVEQKVCQIEPDRLPFQDSFFDQIVIVDLLEHIDTDREFLAECKRTLKSGGKLIVNVPNPKEGLLRRIRFHIGQTDQAHGHLRAGYTEAQLQRIMPAEFKLVGQRSYSRVFSVLIDTAITAVMYFLKRGKHSSKGTIVTGDDMKNFEKLFLMYSFLYPIIALFVFLDKLFPFLHGNMLISSFQLIADNSADTED